MHILSTDQEFAHALLAHTINRRKRRYQEQICRLYSVDPLKKLSKSHDIFPSLVRRLVHFPVCPE
jgi:hypothetical protein